MSQIVRQSDQGARSYIIKKMLRIMPRANILEQTVGGVQSIDSGLRSAPTHSSSMEKFSFVSFVVQTVFCWTFLLSGVPATSYWYLQVPVIEIKQKP